MIHPRTIIFSLLSVSTVLLHAASDDHQLEDKVNIASFMGRESGEPTVSQQDLHDGITLVSVEDEGNENDPDTGLGMVIQKYSISQTEVTARQYCAYLNQVATGENYQLFYNEKMGTDPNVASIKREVVDGKNVYSVIQDTQGDRGDFPIVYVSLYQAARFCNWLQNRNTAGLIADARTEYGAYTLAGKSSGPIARNPNAVWFIPTESEWYKPAYYKGGGLQGGYWHFANRSDRVPWNSLKGGVNSANYYSSGYTKEKPPYLTPVTSFQNSVGTYNTYDMSGNAAEWVATEENQGTTPLKYVARGGSWKSSYYGEGVMQSLEVSAWGSELSKWSRPAYDPTQGYDNIGFRVATSLLVDSTPPATAAPGESELTSTEVLEAPVLVLAGVAAVLSGKKMMECCQDSNERSAAKANRLTNANRERELTENLVTRNSSMMRDQTEDNNMNLLGNDTTVLDINRIANYSDSRSPLTRAELNNEQGNNRNNNTIINLNQIPQRPTITQKQKAAIENSVRSIGTLFETALEKFKAYKQFLKTNKLAFSGEATADITKNLPAGLEPLQKMCTAYDKYATAVKTQAHQIRHNFSTEHNLWIPWQLTTMNVAIESMILTHSAVKDYYRFGVYGNLPQKTQSTVLKLRKDSDQKALDCYEHIQADTEPLLGELEKLAASSNHNNSPQQNPTINEALEKIEAELATLKPIEDAIKKDQGQYEKNMIGVSNVNGAYSDYVIKKTRNNLNPNLYALFYLNDKSEHSQPINLVDAAKLQEQLRAFLGEQEAVIQPAMTSFSSSSTPSSSSSSSVIPSITVPHGQTDQSNINDAAKEGEINNVQQQPQKNTPDQVKKKEKENAEIKNEGSDANDEDEYDVYDIDNNCTIM